MLSEKKARTHGRGWCHPGRGTPSAPRAGRVPPTKVGGAPVDNKEVLSCETRGRSDRVSPVPSLSKIEERRCEADVTADNAPSIVVGADNESARRRDSDFVSDSVRVRDRIHALNISAKH